MKILLSGYWFLFIVCFFISVTNARVLDDFETGAFSEDWQSTNPATIINSPGEGAGSSDYYAHVTGAVGDFDAFGGYFGYSGDFKVSDFSLSFSFRFTDTTQRQFNVIVGISEAALHLV